MYDVQGNLREVLSRLPQGVRLVAISKYHPNEYIEAAYAEGQRTFGESHEQELRLKHETLPKDIEWHFIGHLQTNKVKYIAPYVTMIEAVDSLKLLCEIDSWEFPRAGEWRRCFHALLMAPPDPGTHPRAAESSPLRACPGVAIIRGRALPAGYTSSRASLQPVTG